MIPMVESSSVRTCPPFVKLIGPSEMSNMDFRFYHIKLGGQNVEACAMELRATNHC